MPFRIALVSLLCLGLTALAGCEQCGTEWETTAASPNAHRVAVVHRDVCAATVGFGPTGYEETRVDILDRLGRRTTVLATGSAEDLRPRATWISDDSLTIVVPNHSVFDRLLTSGDGARVTVLFDPPDAAERARWLGYLARRRAFEKEKSEWINRKYSLHEAVGPEPSPPPPYDPDPNAHQ